MKQDHFPSIEQFKTVVKNVTHSTQWRGKDENGEWQFDREAILPTVPYIGTVKLHGTNACVAFNAANEMFCFSRNRKLTVTHDNMGFAFYCEKIKEVLTEIHEAVRKHFSVSEENNILFYGEWCGQGIQGNVAISQLPKMFVIFAVKFGETQWLMSDDSRHVVDVIKSVVNKYYDKDINLYHILEFPTFEVIIDFNNHAEVQNTLVDITNQVEECCPVGKALGVEGVGEGVVWRPKNPIPKIDSFSSTWFKVKGDKHSASKVKKLGTVDMEKLASVNAFIDYAVTQNRLQQMFDSMPDHEFQYTMAFTGHFIKLVNADVFKEELDVLTDSGLEPKEVTKAISQKASAWYKEKVLAT